MASVRTLVPSLLERANEPEAALDVLRRLHVVALLGEDASSFYRPASPIAKKGVWPGRLWLVPSRTLETEAGTRFVEGPRVGARFLGGDRYGALVAELAGDVGATRERLEHRDEAGLDWGRVIARQRRGSARRGLSPGRTWRVCSKALLRKISPISIRSSCAFTRSAPPIKRSP
jgi:hypothetical protein